KTLGSPLALLIENADHAKAWSERMAVEPVQDPGKLVSLPRPGHADLTGAMKFGHRDLRNSLERASARETAMRVGLAAAARRLLDALDVRVGSWVTSIGSAKARDVSGLEGIEDAEALALAADASPVRCIDREAEDSFREQIEEARARREADAAHVERSDTWAVPAAAVVGEAVVALCVADALLTKLGGDSMDELHAALRHAWRRARPLAGHVWLCGLPGAGKTTLAPLLAS